MCRLIYALVEGSYEALGSIHPLLPWIVVVLIVLFICWNPGHEEEHND